MAARRSRPWLERNFVTEVLLPSLLRRRTGNHVRPVFPKLRRGTVSITWIGHASFLVQTPRHNVLVDPNWANWLGIIRRLHRAGFHPHHLPEIDLVLITHAHFDHLNKRSLREIADRQPIVVPHGVGPLVKDLGFHVVNEMHWWDTCRFDGLEVTFTPAKHWGARVLKERGFGGFVMRYQGRSVYHVGDSAYFDGFREIGKRLKPEIVLMPIGAYEPPSGRDVHISPENAMRAFGELGARTLIPMHFGTYRLSFEPLHEPLERLLAAAAAHGRLGDVQVLTEGLPQVF
jgi:L-ascorbate metabolism protein UlaG (beta-lactamase superfamily)